MARIRSIKPEFWQDERLATLHRDHRMLFVGLWTIADDDGRLRGSPLFIRAQVFPYDLDVDVQAGLDALQAIGRIIQYRSGGESYVWICNFRKHQRIDKPKASNLPGPPAAPEPSATNPRRIQDESWEEGRGGEGSGKERSGGEAAPPQPPPKDLLDGATYFSWAQDERTARFPRAIREKPPHVSKLGSFYAELVAACGGDLERAKGTWFSYLGDPWAQKLDGGPCVFRVFMSPEVWPGRVPGQGEPVDTRRYCETPDCGRTDVAAFVDGHLHCYGCGPAAQEAA